MHVVVIGNGIAGINAASVLLSNPAVSVDVYALETHPFYSRVRLPEVLSGAQSPEAITFYKPEWYEKKGMKVHVGQGVASIDRAGKSILLADGKRVSYDYLVIASGASSNRPPLPGSGLSGVFTVRSLEDVAAIRENVALFPDAASVVGGGLLGLEAARALADAGVKSVRVFEIASRLLPRQLDATGAALLQKRFADMGIDIVCSAETKEFAPVGGTQSRAGTIVLKDGRTFASDTTILSMGVHSNTALASACGLAVARGIQVDDRMRTADPYIYAIGDCAEFGGIVWGIVPAALEQAPVAAKAILEESGLIPSGEAPRYVQTVPKTALKIGDVELMSLGKAVLTDEEAASGTYEVLCRTDEAGFRYEKFVLAPDASGATILAGAILYGSKAHQNRVQKISGLAVTREEVQALLAEF